jgi:Glycosyl transferase family 11
MTIFVSLSGGLGNQLFQIAAAKYYSREDEIFLDIKSHSAELADNNKPIISSFIFRDRPEFEILNPFPKVIHKLLSLNLRANLTNQKPATRFLKSWISKSVIEFYLSTKFLKRFHLMTPSSVGKLPIRKSHHRNILINGYFQNGSLLSRVSVSEFMQTAILKFKNAELLNWIEKARINNPIVVHYRIGDYTNHPRMGVLDSRYFRSGVEKARVKAQKREVWLFSDEPLKAVEILKREKLSDVIIVPTFNAASTLELMRYGSGFVLSNSTFSWWAANLRYNLDAKVWAPKPWFRLQESPESIYMPEWNTLASWQAIGELDALNNWAEGAD